METLDRGLVEAKILELMEDLVADPAQLNRDMPLEEFEMGSLDVVEIAHVLEDEFDIEIIGGGSAGGVQPGIRTVGDAIDALLARFERAGLLAGG